MIKEKKSAVLRALALALTVMMIGCGSAGTGENPGPGGNSGSAGVAETAEKEESTENAADEEMSADKKSAAGGLGEGAASGMKEGLFPGARKRAEKEQKEKEAEQEKTDKSDSEEEPGESVTEDGDGDGNADSASGRTEAASEDRTEDSEAGRTEAASEDRTEDSASGRTEAASEDRTEDSEAGRTEAASEDRTEDASAGHTEAREDRDADEKSRGLIVIDPGHQQNANLTQEPIGPGAAETKYSVSGGAIGVASGEPEYQLTLEIGLQLREELEKRGYTVIMVRETSDVDISNSDRAAIANDAGADAFVRIHGNSVTDQNVTGAMTICQTPSNPYNGDLYEQSRALSDCILEAFTQKTGIDYEYVWETDTMSGINWARVPVTILEMGYMSNPGEDMLMQDPDMQEKMAEGIADGIDRFIGNEEPEERQGSMPVDESLLQGENE